MGSFGWRMKVLSMNESISEARSFGIIMKSMAMVHENEISTRESE